MSFIQDVVVRCGFWALVLGLGLAGCRLPCEDALGECDGPCPDHTCVGGEAAPNVPAVADPLPCTRPTPGHLVLNEILADPSQSDINGDGIPHARHDEFVEVINATAYPLDVSGIRVEVNGEARVALPATCLPPGEALVAFGGGDPGPYGDVSAASGLGLSNQGAHVALRGADGVALDQLSYGPEADGPWSLARAPDAVGSWGPHPTLDPKLPVAHSAGRCVNGSLFPACEVPARQPDGDVGLVDRVECPNAEAGELVINEVLADPGLFDANGDGYPIATQDEFVEVLLIAAGPRRVEGTSVEINGHHKTSLPPGCYEPGEGFVVFSGGVPALDYPGVTTFVSDKKLTIANKGGVVALIRNQEVLDVVVYSEEAGHDASLTCAPDGFGGFQRHDEVTLGVPASPGTCSDGALFADGCLTPRLLRWW